VVPPTAALVERMLAGGPWRAGEVLLHEPVRDRAVTAWHAAINAVMAGCRPEYFPDLRGRGAAGGHSAFFPSWSRGRSVPFVSREVPT
jgi:hypothetical protein